MSRTDLVADTFAIIRNAVRTGKEAALIPYSNLVFKICEILKDQEYIANFKKIETTNYDQIKVYFKYDGKKSVINQIEKVSRPSRRIYRKKNQISSVLRGYGMSIISTSQGIFTDRQAREKGLGGEVIAKIW